MAFFDQIGKKITDVGQSVSQSTRNFSDVSRLNSLIGDKKRQIAQLYSKLGETYYLQHRDAPHPELASYISEIDTLNAGIANAEEEIKTIKGIMNCPECGAEVVAGAAFCNACGKKIELQPAPGTKFCPQCGAVVAESNRFCNRCGAKFESPEA